MAPAGILARSRAAALAFAGSYVRPRLALLTVLCCLSITPAWSAAGTNVRELRVRNCAEGTTKVPAQCGTLRVFENRREKTGRTILVHFIVLKAKHPSGQVIYVNLGGPAEELSAVPIIADGGELKELAALRERFDILFVDERGFGQSHPIACQLAPPAHPEVYFLQRWPDELLADCRVKAILSSDLAQYNTPNAVDDLDDLRAALGYRKLNFDVGSYGTFTALVYMRRHPEHVQSAVLMSVDPPGIADLSRDFARGAQVALDRLSAGCRRDAVCRANFPGFDAHFHALLRRFDRGPVEVKVNDAATKRQQTVKLSREVFVDAVRHMLYDPEGASYVPFIIERAYRGDTLPLGTVVDEITRSFATSVTEGAYLSYTCAEVVPFGNSTADLTKARATSWFGDDRVVAQQRACAIWNVPAFPAAFDEPVRSAAPNLLISGTDDPATPSYEATEELKYLTNARQMLIENAPHDAESPCTDKVVERFIGSGGSFAGLDLGACAGDFKRPPFATSFPPSGG